MLSPAADMLTAIGNMVGLPTDLCDSQRFVTHHFCSACEQASERSCRLSDLTCLGGLTSIHMDPGPDSIENMCRECCLGSCPRLQHVLCAREAGCMTPFAPNGTPLTFCHNHSQPRYATGRNKVIPYVLTLCQFHCAVSTLCCVGQLASHTVLFVMSDRNFTFKACRRCGLTQR